MAALGALLIPIIVAVTVALIIVLLTNRFAPDPVLNKIIQYVVFAALLIFLIVKLLPLIH